MISLSLGSDEALDIECVERVENSELDLLFQVPPELKDEKPAYLDSRDSSLIVFRVRSIYSSIAVLFHPDVEMP